MTSGVVALWSSGMVRVSRIAEVTTRGGGIRGAISEFTEGSRYRLMKWLASLDDGVMPYFLTFTYPDSYDASDPGDWKRHIDIFAKRLARRWPGAFAVWRLERMPRKSGVHVGKLYPHFHLLVWGVLFTKEELQPLSIDQGTEVDDLRALQLWVSRSWFEVVGTGDEKHLQAGTRCEKIRSRRGVLWYVSKYIAKIEDDPGLSKAHISPPSGESAPGVGRWWGAVGRDNAPVAPVKLYYLAEEEKVNLALELVAALRGSDRARFLTDISFSGGQDLIGVISNGVVFTVETDYHPSFFQKGRKAWKIPYWITRGLSERGQDD